MKLAATFFANQADMTNDHLQVSGGMWDGLTASRYPAAHDIVVVLMLRPELKDVGESFHVDLNVTGPDGESAGHDHRDVTLNQYKQQTAVVMTVKGSFAASGRYSVKTTSQAGTDEIFFQVVGQGESPVAAAVEGYALGLKG